MSRKFTVVTSFSRAGYNSYGKKFLDTFRRHWPSDVDLIVYHEGTPEEDLLGYRGVDLRYDVPSFARFTATYGNDPEIHGVSQRAGFYWKPKAVEAGYNFRFDAMKFCRKVFALEHVVATLDGTMIWVDADVVTFDTVNKQLLVNTNPSEFSISHLARDNYHSECGYVGYDLNQAECRNFLSVFAGMYLSGRVFNLPEWHDSYVFDWLLKELGIRDYKIPSKTNGHVFISSELGACMDHLKGDRKITGRSKKAGIDKIHDHQYWSGQ